MGRKKKVVIPIDPNTPICCVCKKYIVKKDKTNIGANLVGYELFRHDGCYLHNLPNGEYIKLKNCTEMKLKEKKKCISKK